MHPADGVRTSQVTYSKAKAIAAAVLGFIAPGVGLLVAEQKGDGIQSGDLLLALLLCIGGSAAIGGTVYAVRNRPIEKPLPPADDDLPEGNWLG